MISPDRSAIQALRAEHGFTQAQCAELLHTSIRAYQQWEYGERRMHPALWECMQIKLSLRAPLATA